MQLLILISIVDAIVLACNSRYANILHLLSFAHYVLRLLQPHIQNDMQKGLAICFALARKRAGACQREALEARARACLREALEERAGACQRKALEGRVGACLLETWKGQAGFRLLEAQEERTELRLREALEGRRLRGRQARQCL